MTRPDLSAIRAQLAGITPGEWRHERAVMSDVVETSNRVHVASIHSQHDAAFIAAAPSTVAGLLAMVERVEDLIGWLDAASADDEPMYAKGKVSARATADRLRAAITGEGGA